MNHFLPLVLIVESNNFFRVELEHILAVNDIKTISATSGRSALALIKKTSGVNVYLIEPELPDINNFELINQIKQKDLNAEIIVYTKLADPKFIIKTMKKGVFDFFLKPEKNEIILKSVLKAIEIQQDISEEQVIANDIVSHIQEEITWMSYKLKNFDANKNEGVNKDAIHDLKSSFVQSNGISSGISTVKLLDATKKIFDENNFLINKDIFQVALENNIKSEMVYNAIGLMENLYKEPFIKESFTVNKIIMELFEFVELLQGILPDKMFSIRISSADFKKNVILDIDKFLVAVEELMVNSYKYSLPASGIDIMLSVYEGYFSVSVKNNITDSYSIPKDQEHEILKPFRRLCPVVENKIPVEKYPVGLGLPVVDYIARNHNGIFTVREIADLLSATGKSVIAEILYPLEPNGTQNKNPVSSVAV